MNQRRDVRYHHELEAMQEAAEREQRQARERSRPARAFKSGVERPISDLGDTLFTADMRSQREVLWEQAASSREWIYLRTRRAGQETGSGNASIEIQRDERGDIIANRTWLHDIIITPPHRDQGYDDVLLQEVELHARRFGSTEVYYALGIDDDGELPPALERNGYRMRPGGLSGREAYKPLITPAIEAEPGDR